MAAVHPGSIRIPGREGYVMHFGHLDSICRRRATEGYQDVFEKLGIDVIAGICDCGRSHSNSCYNVCWISASQRGATEISELP